MSRKNNAMPEEQQAKLIEILNRRLADAIDLHLQSRQAYRPWLSQVAHHRSIDELRRRRPILFCEIELYPDGGDYSYLTTLPDPDRQPEEQVELFELRGLLLDAIETNALALPHGCANAL